MVVRIYSCDFGVFYLHEASTTCDHNILYIWQRLVLCGPNQHWRILPNAEIFKKPIWP
jgi:hypothetical protein